MYSTVWYHLFAAWHRDLILNHKSMYNKAQFACRKAPWGKPKIYHWHKKVPQKFTSTCCRHSIYSCTITDKHWYFTSKHNIITWWFCHLFTKTKLFPAKAKIYRINRHSNEAFHYKAQQDNKCNTLPQKCPGSKTNFSFFGHDTAQSRHSTWWNSTSTSTSSLIRIPR